MRSMMVVVGVAALSMSACGSDDSGGDIEGVEATAFSIGGVTVPDDVTATLLLNEGRATGSSGCNTFNGSYTIDGDNLTFDGVATTRMACVGEAMVVEAAFLDALNATAGFETPDGDAAEFSLLDADGNVLMQFSY